MDQLYHGVKLSDRCYLFDNSGRYYELIAEISSGKTVQILDYDKIMPNWFVEYIWKKAKGKY